ncbi:MAG: hypothetical protein SGI99_17200 [Pseudomonadota bacterium]|nr:hypothetical protein [Pseudomonadota bacterium]
MGEPIDEASYLSFSPEELRSAIGAEEANACALGVDDPNPTEFIAIQVTRRIVAAVAQISPAAAQTLVVLRAAPVVPPLRVHGGEGFSDRAPTMASVLSAFDDPTDETSTEKMMAPLPSAMGHLSRLDIDMIGDRTLLVVQAGVADEKKHFISTERLFAIELRAIPGTNTGVGGNDEHRAQVYEVLSFGYRDRY